MPNPENIRPPKKGERRNPNGRGLGHKNRSTILKKWIEVSATFNHPITKEEFKGTIEDMVGLALLKRAIEGDVQAIKEVNDTMYGKLQEKQQIKHTGVIKIKLKGG